MLDATLNPDFSQVELDAPQLAGNTRFALSVPEKRPFFLESTDVIDQPIGGFYSRSVTDPRYGLRATWRAPKADATALTLRDEGGGLVLRPGAFATAVFAQDGASQATLLRARRHDGAFTSGVLLSDRDYGARGRNSRGRRRCVLVAERAGPAARALDRLAHQRRLRRAGPGRAHDAERGHWLELRWNRRSDRLDRQRRLRRHRAALSQRQRLRRAGRRAPLRRSS